MVCWTWLKGRLYVKSWCQYPEDVTALLQQNHQKSAYCHVQRYDQDNSEFEVQEISNPHQYRPKPIWFTVRLNDWWCDCGHFQASWLPCHHVIAVSSFGHMPLTNFIDQVYSLDYINKAYQVQFHPLRNGDYWSTYTGLNFNPNPQTRHNPDDLQRLGSITKWINPLRINQKNAFIVPLRVIIGDNVHFANNLYIFNFN